MRRACLLCVLCACGRVGFDARDDGGGGVLDDGRVVDGTLADAAPWGAATLLLGGTGPQEDPTGSSNKLEIIFLQNADLYTIKRPDESSPWGAPVLFLGNSVAATDAEPRLSPDDKTLYFASDRAGGAGGLDIWYSTRPNTGANWSAPVELVEVNTAQDDKWFAPCANGRYVMVRGANGDLLEGTLGGGAPVPITEVNSASNDISAYLTPDCLTLLFASNRMAEFDLYVSTRASIAATWSAPQRHELHEVGAGDQDPWQSSDGKMFVFASDKGGNFDLYIATR